jgi:small subunit ribosomal protein S4
VDRPSYRLRPGDLVEVAQKAKRKEPFLLAASGAHADAPPYLLVHLADLIVRVERTPSRDEVPIVCEEQLVVEYYSR